METVLIPVTEYLSRSYRPDREYLDGELLERNVGEWNHSKLQARLIVELSRIRARQALHVVPEQRVEVSPTRFRVPDVCVVLGAEPAEQILTIPPFLCIEILSKGDRMTEMRERIDDYLRFGVPCVWVLDPKRKRAYIHSAAGSYEVKDGVLKTAEAEVRLTLAQLF